MTTTLEQSAQAPATRRQQARTLRLWADWCTETDMDPARASSLVAAVEAWHGAGLAAATIRSRDAWIRPTLEDGHAVELRRTLRGLARVSPSPRPVGWTVAEVRALVDAATEWPEHPRAGRWWALQLRALVLWAFFGAFRVSELLALRLGDVKADPGGLGLEVMIRRSKTDQEARGRRVLIPSTGGALCPVAAWRELRGLRGVEDPDGPAWVVQRAGDRPVSERTAARWLAELVAAARVRPAAWHALRRAHVTAARDAGATDAGIQQQTGHRSIETLARYDRPADWSRNSSLILKI